MNILYIDQLIVMAKIGIYDWEKQRFQKLIFDLKIIYNYTSTNNIYISNYLDYTKINRVILDILNIRHFNLIEDVAEIIANTLMSKFSMICRIQVKVSKPGAISNARNVGICIVRRKLYNFKKINIYTG